MVQRPGPVEILEMSPAAAAAPNAAFWASRRVLVTGHTGFKGSWLSWMLHALGAEVHGLALAPEPDSLFDMAEVASILASDLRVDIRQPERLAQAVADCRPQVVLHLAAQALVRVGYEDPLGTYDTNVQGTANLLQACRDRADLQAVLVVTTDKVYRDERQPWPYRETDPLGGHDPYSNSKACAELVVQAFRGSYFSGDARPRLVTARAGNVIGGGDRCRDRLLPDLFRALRAGRPLALRHPHATRPWQHVLDALSGYLVLAEAMAGGRAGLAPAYNFGPSVDEIWSVADVARQACHQWGGGDVVTLAAPDGPHESLHLRLDASLARQSLGWQPRLDTRQAIAWTVDWERQLFAGQPAHALMQAQIRAHLGPGR